MKKFYKKPVKKLNLRIKSIKYSIKLILGYLLSNVSLYLIFWVKIC